MALVEDFKELIDTTVKAGKDSYKHVDLANSTLWLYHRNNQFKDTEFAEVVNNDYPKYQIQVQQEMNGEGE